MYDVVDGWLFVDPAPRTGLCLVNRSGLMLDTIYLGRERRERALWRYLDDMRGRIVQLSPTIVCVEGYALRAQSRSAQTQVEMGAAVRMAGGSVGVPVIEINPATWKSVTFKGEKGTKAKNADYCYTTEQLTGFRPSNIDEADALLMAHAADIILRDRSRWTVGMQTFRDAVTEATK